MNLRQRFIQAQKSLLGRLLLIGLVLVNVVFLPRTVQASAELSSARDPIWNARTNDAPAFLRMLDNPHDLYSEYTLSTLAGHLINYGVVDAHGCPSGGLQHNGKANGCGAQSAMSAAEVWQNRYNVDIINASQATGVPPILIKNIFVWESQFWPETVFINTSEFGLGHMTEMGADSLLRWNYPFYDSFCNANLSSDRCQHVYVEQPDYVQAMLRGLVIQQADADCSNCTYSLDLTRAENSIPVFANTLVANANLVKHYIKLYTGSDAADTSSYEDLWDFALTSYNAGPGCFKNALLQTIYSKASVTWKNLSSKLDPACQGASVYVKFISKTDQYRPQDDPAINPAVAPTVSVPTSDITQTVSVQTPTTATTQTVSAQTPVPTTPETENSATPVTAASSSQPTSTSDVSAGSETPLPTSTLPVTQTISALTPTSTTPETENSATPVSTMPSSQPTSTAGFETPVPTSTLSVTQTISPPSPTSTTPETENSATPVSTTPSSQPTSMAGSETPTTVSTDSSSLTSSPTTSAGPTDMTPIGSVTPQVIATVSVSSMLKPLHVGNELVMKIDPQQRDSVLQTLASLNVSLAPSAEQVQSLDTMVLRVDPSNMNTALAKLKSEAGVEFVEPNYLVSTFGLPADATLTPTPMVAQTEISATPVSPLPSSQPTSSTAVSTATLTQAAANNPNDPLFTDQNYLQKIQVPQAWNALPTLQPVIVAVLDTGVNITHPDLMNSIWQNSAEAAGAPNADDDNNGYVDDLHGWNFVNGSNDVNDDNGHGTHLAGIIAASTNNSIGVAGIAPNARIMPVKVLDKNGYGSYANVADGIIYATNMGAHIIELGFGGTGSSELMQNAINYALAHNVLIVAAAGNSGNTTTYYPAGYYGVVAVSALDNNNLASFSSSGNDVSLSAPGVGIISTGLSGNYPYMSGTSVASAEVAGVAALLAGEPQFTDTSDLRSALLGSALDLGTSGRDPQYGYGEVQALSALNYSGQVIPPSTPSGTVTPVATSTGVGIDDVVTETLYGTAQSCSYTIGSPANSIDLKINNSSATCTGTFAADPVSNWTYTAMQPLPNLQSVNSVKLNVAFSIAGFDTSGSPDTIALQVSNDKGATWSQVAVYQADQAMLTQSYDVSSYFKTAAQVNNVQVRFVGSAQAGTTANTITINLDEARLDVTGTDTPPAISITTPSNNSTYSQGTNITFTGTANDAEDGDLTSSTVWYSNLSGPIGTGASVSTSALIPGTHTINAQVTDSAGLKTIASIAITITPLKGLHGNFSQTTDQCAVCHRTHTAQSPDLINNPNSVFTSDAFCLSCHSDVSTHSNENFSGTVEQPFVVHCIQCHDPHGSSNLFDIRTNIITNLTTQTTVGPVIFTSLTGSNSFDDGTSANRLCLVCHTNITLNNNHHPGGAQHIDPTTGNPTQDYTGLSCVACHPHNADTNSSTLDGFMPVRSSNP